MYITIRFFDIIFSLLAIVILFPILFLIVIILKFTGEGEVFYFQNRVGKDGKIFSIYKFATMIKNSHNIGSGTVTIEGDPRILPFGKILRKTKINELPQLFNIIKGDMSIIGPRPRTERFFNALSIDEKNLIVQVKPGLSGIGSIVFRNEDKILKNKINPVEYDLKIITPYKSKLEGWFIEKKSFYLYFKLIILTILFLFGFRINLKKLFKDLPEAPIDFKNIIGG